MKIHNLPILMCFFIVMLISSACSLEVPPTPQAPTTPQLKLSMTLSSTATSALATTPAPTTPQSTTSPTRPTPTKTVVLPSQPLPTTLVPGDWRVPVVSISDLIGQDFYFPTWDEQNRLLIENPGTSQFINPLTGKVEATATPVPTLAWGGEAASSSKEYEVICSSDGVRMVRLADQQIMAEAHLAVECYMNVNWASNGSAAALITQRGDLYVWEPNGSQPRMVGQGLNFSAPMWSPDNTRILFTDQVEGNFDPTIVGLSIAFLDGRPMLTTGAQVDAGNNWDPTSSLNWETNRTIHNRLCGVDYCYYDYYDAETGHFLIRTNSSDTGGREPAISPNGRWLVLEGDQRAVDWEHRWENLYLPGQGGPGLIVVDLITLRRSLVIQSNTPGINGESQAALTGSDNLKFLGWNADSSKFYFVHFPFGSPEYDLPVGLLALYPNNGYLEQVLPDIAYGLASPDRKHTFLVTADTVKGNTAIGLKAGIYYLDGVPVTALQPVAENIEYSTLNEVDVYSTKSTRLISSEWSPDGSRLVYADTGGNIWIMDTAGNTTQLAANLPKESWDGNAIFSWSPDGQYLLIKSAEHAWLVQVQQ